LEWTLKNWAYDHSRLAIVSPSSFQTEQAKQSMLKRFPIHQIPHGIDTKIYQPLDREECRRLLGIPKEKRILMFAATALNMINKGGGLLMGALKLLPNSLKAEVVLLTLGEGGEAIQELAGVDTVSLGYVANDRLKTIAYGAADLFVQPSRAESFSLVVQESMACGTPVIAFQVGGIVDLVRPGLTGYLAKLEDPEDFSNGIRQLLEDDSLRTDMSLNCRRIALQEYSIELQVQRHMELYSQLL